MIIERQTMMALQQLHRLWADGKAWRPKDYPLAEVFETVPGVYSIFGRSPGAGGDAWTHLIIGEERAMVVDTGFGIGDLRGLIESLTDKSYDVFNTHFHGDHTFGNVQFDRVYIHRYDLEPLQKMLTPTAREGFVPDEGEFYTLKDIPPFKPYEVLPVDEGYTFDLGGGETLEVVHLPGHTAGGAALLDHKKRILFSGDAICGTPTFIFGALPAGEYQDYYTVHAFRDALEKLAKRVGEFDVLYPGHNYLGVPNEIVPQELQVCESILANPDQYDDMLGSIGRTGMVRQIGWGSVAYSKERL